MVLEIHLTLCMIFLEIFFWHKNWENGPKIGFFEFIEKYGHYFFTESVQEWYCLLCCSTKPLIEKNLVPETLTKLLSASQLVGFLYRLYPQKRWQPNFVHSDTVSQKLTDWRFFGVDLVRNRFAQSGHRSLHLFELKNEQMEKNCSILVQI